MTVPVSVLIPTRNEEKNIRKCLDSVSWAAEVYVVDSSSTDRTAELAQGQGATVVQFSWDRQGPRKKNWALDHLPWKYEWVLVVDHGGTQATYATVYQRVLVEFHVIAR